MSLSSKLETWRKDLIDMSKRNPLLYYRSKGKRPTGIQFLPDNPALLFSQLCGNPGSIALDRVPCAIDPDELERRPLDRRLLRLQARVREDERDRGVKTLYLVFGILEWYESASSQELIRSPLVFVPVSLIYKAATGSFTLKFLDDIECEINPTLREKLNHDFKIVLPTFSSITSADSASPPELDDLLSAIQDVLPHEGHWKILPETHLGRFAFQKLVMYQDLQRHSEDVLAHPLLQVLGGDAPCPPLPSDLPSADELDDRLRPTEMLEILDADSSQQEAILLAKADVSYVLIGPPGTGKSQTIANIIAERLGQGKHVLFVSEKMAALDVVRKRIDDAGLGDFCLDLHNPRTNSNEKAKFLNALKTSLDDAMMPAVASSDARWDRQSSNLQRYRNELNSYVKELHQERNPLGKSAYAAYGVLANLADVPDRDFTTPNISAVTADEFGAMLRAVDDLSKCRDVLDAYDSYPWHETLATSYSLELASTIRAHYTKLSGGLRTLHSALARILNLIGENAAVNFIWIPYAVERAKAALASPHPLRTWLNREELARLRPVVVDMMERSKTYNEQLQRFTSDYVRAMLSEDLPALQQTLTENSAWAVSCLRDQVGSQYDTAIALRAEFEHHLPIATQALKTLPAAVRTLAELCGVEQPETLDEINGLITVARHLLQTPSPPLSWLNPSTFAVARALAAEAQERYAQSAQIRATLESVYQPAFFALDFPGLADRFRTQYRSLFRFLQSSYRRDIKLVRSLLLPGQARSATQIEADIYLATKLQEMEKALAGKRIEYAQTLDRYFDGPNTDWEKVTVAIQWVVRLHDLLAGVPISKTMVSLITGQSKALRPVNAALEKLSGIFTTWEEVETFCLTNLQIPLLLQGAGSFDDEAPAQAQAAIDRLLGDLQQFWQAVDIVQRHRHVKPDPGRPVQWSSLCAGVALAQRIHEFEARLAALSEDYSRDFGHFYRGAATDWQSIDEAITWTEYFLNLYGVRAIPESIMSLVAYPGHDSRHEALQAALTVLQQTIPQTNEELRFSDTVLARTALNQPEKTFDTSKLTAIADRVDFLIENLPALERWLTCQQRLNMCRQVGLGNYVDNLLAQRPIPRDISAIFQRRFYTLWLDHIRAQSPILARYHGIEHSELIQRFRDLDAGHKKLAQQRLNAILRQRRREVFSGLGAHPSPEISQAVTALRRETTKKRRSPIRKTVQKTAQALLELKPCWMMSPLSVSQYLESASQLFDLVIFDEASQVCPEDSISSILRGKQLIVVGDPKQLPPTRFFAKSLADESGEDDEIDGGEEEERTQSILDECLGSAFASRSLTWHYRSADESLIAFSNYHFYDRRLVTFPSSCDEAEKGVRFEYVENSNYSHGRNRNEAMRVADIVLGYVQRHEKPSLGVVALSAAQQEAITDALDARTREPYSQQYRAVIFNENPDGIFIKNLESVQGDERDTIILSIGYGRDASGNIYKRFGPVNNAGGERRLNVAVTRARKQMIVVSSMRARDLPPDMSSAGSRILRDYLEYVDACSGGGAQHGVQVLTEQIAGGTTKSTNSSEPQFDSPFEEAVYNALTARGLALDTQIGCSGYRIDMAVRDPEHPGSYLLGIECDGATYHSSKTARDRDRLRQRQLEKMGWKLHRIWSSDWFADSTTETLRVLRSIEDVTKLRNSASGPDSKHIKAAGGVARNVPDDAEERSSDLSTTRPASSLAGSAEFSDNVKMSRSIENVAKRFEAKRPNGSATRPVASQPPLTRAGSSDESTQPKPGDAIVNHRQPGVKPTAPLSILACEDCHYFMPLSPTEFRCGWNGKIKKAGENGHTPACLAWRQAQ